MGVVEFGNNGFNPKDRRLELLGENGGEIRVLDPVRRQVAVVRQKGDGFEIDVSGELFDIDAGPALQDYEMLEMLTRIPG